MGRPTTLVAVDLTNVTRKAVVRVRNVACLGVGTAFFIGGQLVTNRHVVAGSSTVQLSTWDGTDLGGTTAAISAVNDLARVTSSTVRPSKLGFGPVGDPPAGEKVWIAGYPEGNQLQLTQGTVIDEVDGSKYQQSGSVIRATASIKPGNSGSPVLDASGQVVGVAFALEKATGDALIVPASALQRFLSGQQPTLNLTPPCASGSVSLSAVRNARTEQRHT